MSTNKFKEVSEEDYKVLEAVFRDTLEDTVPFILEHPELAGQLDRFIGQIGIVTKDLLQKYGKSNYIMLLEVEDYKTQFLNMRRQMVKMNLRMKQVDNAIQAYKNVSRAEVTEGEVKCQS